MLSIIIPVLNEADSIRKLLDHLNQNTHSDNIEEVIVVDGGSSDETIELVQKYSTTNNKLPVTVYKAEKGRAQQMNYGASKASGTLLYFLHADTFPPKGFDQKVITAINGGSKAGCFRMKFDTRHPVLLISQWFTRFNLKACRGGDQSLFVTKEVFHNLGGYDEAYTIYEDCEFIGRIYDGYKFEVLDDYVVTSARRYENNGTLKLQFHFAMIHFKKWTGATPSELSRYYLKYIVS